MLSRGALPAPHDWLPAPAQRRPAEASPRAQAINLMRRQAKGGLVYNMEGAGADGNATANFAAYGATKRGLKQLCNSLQVGCRPAAPAHRAAPPCRRPCQPIRRRPQAELKAAGVSNVGVHALSPGMVTTELLMSGEARWLPLRAAPRAAAERRRPDAGLEERPRAQFFVNVLAETANTCAAALVPQLRGCLLERQARGGVGKDIRFLTKLKAYTQLAARLAFGVRKDRHVVEQPT